jgi:hypothetical protein
VNVKVKVNVSVSLGWGDVDRLGMVYGKWCCYGGDMLR